jgi:hypothetical protein
MWWFELVLEVQLVLLAVALGWMFLLYVRPKVPAAGPASGPIAACTGRRSVPRPALPEGHNWPAFYDACDGVVERWVCRDCGESHLRKLESA